MASGNMQATYRNRNMPAETVRDKDMLMIPEAYPAAPSVRQAVSQQLLSLYTQAVHLKRENLSESQQVKIRFRTAMNNQTERFREGLKAGKSLEQFFKEFQILVKTAIFR